MVFGGFMQSGTRTVAVLVILGASVGMVANTTPPSHAADVQVHLGRQFLTEGRYQDALEAFKNAVATTAPDHVIRQARTGIVQAALRVAEFNMARETADELTRQAPRDPEVASLHGDALWAVGSFEEAEQRYRDSVTTEAKHGRGRHGIARSLVARSRLDAALNEAQAAASLSPRDLEIHHTIGSIYERMHRFDEAAVAFGNYVNLLPNKDRSEKADWARAQIKFLRSFGQRVPFQLERGSDDEIYSVDFRLVNDKVIVRAKVNDSPFQDFVVDTGAENTILSAPMARRLGVTPITHTLTAGVGQIGLRGLQLARIDSLELGNLKLRNVPAMIKDPALRNLPVKEMEGLSPLALGYSMVIDYKTNKITFGKRLPEEEADFELPLRMYRLALVRGTINGSLPATFVVDTGGEVISISHALANALTGPPPPRRIPLKVFGSSGWDPEAFLMPGVDLAFDTIRYTNFPVVVLNLDMPSALLGFQLGGIVGHRFLSKYRVGIDLERSVLRLKELG
jgi:Flp pilus assembly protein TadD/predicted aspartyl protease